VSGLDPNHCLGATTFIDSDSGRIRGCLEELNVSDRSDADRAIALFDFVRDSIAYDFAAPTTPEAYRASAILENGRGHCVRKAILLSALARAADIPTALVFADLRDHSLSAEIVKLMGTDILHHHGLVAFYLGGQWLKADPTTPRLSAAKKGIRLVAFDGTGDALGHSTLEGGRQHLEYVAFHGMYEDMPFVEVMRSLAENYSKGNSSRFKDLGLSASNDFEAAANAYSE